MKKRILSFLLALLMVVSIFPAPAYATDSADVTITPTEIPCPTCCTVGCTSEHLNWCTECKKDDCGKDHNTTEPTDPATEPVALIDEGDGDETHPMVGKYVKLTASTTFGYVTDPNWSYVIVGSYPAFMEISDVLEKDGVTYYRLKAAPGYTWPTSGGYSDDTVYLEAAKLVEIVWCADCQKYDCGTDHTATEPSIPENSCGCCDDCTGEETCECLCGKCDFCEKAEDPDVPSISATVNGQTVIVSGDALPEGAELVVVTFDNEANMLAESAIGGNFIWDVSILDADGNEWEPSGGEYITIQFPADGIEDGKYLQLYHFLDTPEAVSVGLANGTALKSCLAEFGDSFSGALTPALKAYQQVTGSTDDTLVVEILPAYVTNGKAVVNVTSFSVWASGGVWQRYTNNGDDNELNLSSNGGTTFYATIGQTIRFGTGAGTTGAYKWRASLNGTTTDSGSIWSYTSKLLSDRGSTDANLNISSSNCKVGDTIKVWFDGSANAIKGKTVTIIVVNEVKVTLNENRSNYGAGNDTLTGTTPNAADSKERYYIWYGSTVVSYAKTPQLAQDAGYIHTGWNTKADGTGTNVTTGSNYAPTSATTLYAQWTPITYTVKFDPNTANANGGTVTGSMSNLSMTYDVETTLPRNQFVNQGDGMVFLGWATSPTGDVVYKDGAQVSNLTTTNGATVTLYAKWKYGLNSTVYIGINNTYHNPNGTYTAGGVTIPSYHRYPNEPAQMTGDFDRVVDTTGSWTYDKESARPLAQKANAYIKGNIFNSPDYEMTYVQGENTLGIADPTGAAVRAMLNFTEADYNAMIAAWLEGMRSTLIGYGDTSVDWKNAKANDFVMVPYVIKFQNYDSWYIDMVVKPKALYTLAYDGNIENGYTASFTGVAFPPSAQHTEGTNVSVVSTPIGYQNNNLKVTKVIDGHTYTAEFQYWYDAKGNTYGGSTGRNTITLTEDTILYAKWNYPDASFGNLNITKTVVDRDAYEDPSATQSFTFKFTTNAAGNYNYTIYDRAANVKATGTIANNGTFTLQDGWRIRITDLPKGATYTVTETAVNYYTASGTVSGTISAGATTYATVTNTFQKNAGYTVKHYLQNNDKTGYIEQAADQQNLYGIIGQSTSALAKTYSGYTVNTFSQAAISADGSTVISIYYDLVSTATVIWKNWDGTVLETDENVAYGTMPSYDGETPAKADTAQYTYTFDGWVEEIVAVTGDATYTAKFKETVNKYKVTFVDEDGTILLVETEYDYGTKAADIAKPTDPTKEGNDEFTYTFAGWTPEITDVTKNVVYTATYSNVTNQYTMTGVIDHGTVTDPVTVDYGEEAKLSFTPDMGYEMTGWRISTESEDNVFTTPGTSTWDYEVSELKHDVTVTVYTHPIQYIITYDLNDGELAAGVTNPETYTIETETFTLNNPVRAGYKFKGWATSENASVVMEAVTVEKGSTGNLTYYAVWERSLVDLTIKATTADTEQSFIFTVSGTRSDGVAFAPIDVVLCSENNFQVTIKDLPVGEYAVTEKNGWSWRENAVESKTADLRTTSQTVSFDFYAVDDLHWLSGYSYKRKKGGS